MNQGMDAPIVLSESELEQYIMPPPKYLGLEVTQRCNLRCPMCHEHGPNPHSEFVGRDMKLDVLDLLAPTLRTAHEVLLSGSGEPIVLPNFFEFVDKCHEHNPDLDVTFISNGVLFNERVCRTVIEKRVHLIEFSMDGTIQYGHVGGGADYDRVKDNLRRLARLKEEYGVKEPYVNIAFVAMRDNLCELPDLIEFASEIDAVVRVQPLSPITEEQRNQNVFRHVDYTLRALNKCKVQADQLGVKFEYKNMKEDLEQVPHRCNVPDTWLWMTYEGMLTPCCGGLTTGRNIYEPDLDVQEIWNGAYMLRLRWELATGNYNDTCRQCPLLWNTLEGQERALSPHPPEKQVELYKKQIKSYSEQLKQLEYDKQVLMAHIEAIRRGKVMRILRMMDRLLGRE
jgi:MoaA/NifB/PqqE/SkfB family radical SAM enzyme